MGGGGGRRGGEYGQSTETWFLWFSRVSFPLNELLTFRNQFRLHNKGHIKILCNFLKLGNIQTLFSLSGA